MKKIYIYSPLRDNYALNITRAKWYCREVAKRGHIPIAPHVYCTQFLEDTDPEEREMGMEIGLNLLDICDEVWVFGYQLSTGMKAEIERAANKGIPVYFK